MILDHIIYLQELVNNNIVDSNGDKFLKGRFLEFAPTPGELTEKLPCCVLSSRVSPPLPVETDAKRIVYDQTIELIKQEYSTEHTYTLSFYSRDIYHHIEDDSKISSKPLVNQAHDYLNQHKQFTRRDGNNVEVRAGLFGFMDEAGILKDGIYMSFCHLIMKDGIYSSRIIPRVTGATFE